MDNLTGGNSAQIKKNQITEYLSNYDTKNISVSKIKQDLQQILGETPGVSITWSKTEKLNENNVTEVIEDATDITIIFTEDNTSTNNRTPDAHVIKFLI